MTENILNKITVKVDTDDVDNVKRSIIESLYDVDTDKIYSYTLQVTNKDNKFDHWKIEYLISQTDEYNTINTIDAISEIIQIVKNYKHDKEGVIGYKQPPVNLMVVLYEPLIRKLAKQQSDRWRNLEYEDAKQMCYLVLLDLYNKNYYIHKNLLTKSYENYVLMYLRRDKYKPVEYSMEQVVYETDTDEAITYGDSIADESVEIEEEDKENQEMYSCIFSEIRDILVEMMGQRQFDQFYRDYVNKHTTTATRKKMIKVKERLRELGITLRSFNKYY